MHPVVWEVKWLPEVTQLIWAELELEPGILAPRLPNFDHSSTREMTDLVFEGLEGKGGVADGYGG